MSKLVRVERRLNFMSTHQFLFWLRSSLAMPAGLLYLLHTSPCHLFVDSIDSAEENQPDPVYELVSV